MTLFDIWTEGYLETGMEGVPAKAQKMNDKSIEAETFDEAVSKFVKTLDEKTARFWHRTALGRWSFWGCRAFPDEESARRSFG